MEEREALKRQIELLQNLINNHKSVHGDAPSSAGPRQQERATSARGHDQSSYVTPTHTPSGVLNLPVPAGQWRKTYSISNKRNEASQNRPTQTPVSMSSSGSLSRSLQATRAGRSGSPPSHCLREDLVNRESGGAGGLTGGSCAQGRTLTSATEVLSCRQRAGAGDEAEAGTKTPAFARTGVPLDDSQKQLKQNVQSRHEASKFTWVKSQEAGGSGPQEARAEPLLPEAVTSPPPAPDSNAGACGGPSPSLSITKKPPTKKVPRRLSLSAASPKTSKYTWVSSSVGGQSKISRKPLSPRALALLHRAPERGEAARRARAAQPLTGKQRKGTGACSSRYCWKAGAQGGTVAGTGRMVPHRGSVFCWSSENEPKGSLGRARVEPSSSLASSHSPGGFKLRSRMKIIRKSPSGGGGPERRASPAGMTVRSRYSLHRRTTHTLVRTHPPGRSPGALKRSPCRELVSFGRHKLRRLSPGSSRTEPSSADSSVQQRAAVTASVGPCVGLCVEFGRRGKQRGLARKLNRLTLA
ncbi:zinc finger CCCH domain-containing protein 3 [Osmerus mordax]|uniref:zinc finger CCCH domain-containing protein 3 n=1 Tax=Osmerus mordax TaxID=8014 RepID=UPI003510A101